MTELTERTVRVLEVFLGAPDERHYAPDIEEAAELRPGTSYPHLTRLEYQLSWIAGGWDEQPVTGSQRRRRWWVLTDKGRQEGGRQVAQLRQRQQRQVGLNPGWQGA